MDKIAAAGINTAHQALLDRMQQTAMLASAGSVNTALPRRTARLPAPTRSLFPAF